MGNMMPATEWKQIMLFLEENYKTYFSRKERVNAPNRNADFEAFLKKPCQDNVGSIPISRLISSPQAVRAVKPRPVLLSENVASQSVESKRIKRIEGRKIGIIHSCFAVDSAFHNYPRTYNAPPRLLHSDHIEAYFPV